MSTGRIFWYPIGGALQSLNLGKPWTTIREREVRNREVVESLSGRRVTTIYTGYREVTAVAELITDTAVARQLETLVNFLHSGGTIAIAETSGDTYAGYLQYAPNVGDTVLTIWENQWKDWGTPDIASGDMVVVQGPSPEYRREECAVTARSGKEVTISPGVLNDYTDLSWVFLRDKRFHPYLRLQKAAMGQPLLTHDRRISWTLELPLEEIPPALEQGAEAVDSAFTNLTSTNVGLLDYNSNSSTSPFGTLVSQQMPLKIP